MRKLGRKAAGLPEAEQAEFLRQVDRALDELQARGLLDERRAAEAIVAAKAARFGTRRLEHLMQAKGIPEDLAARALDALRGTELERARAAWQRRFDAPPGDARERLRQQRFLAGRGFDAETVTTLLRALRRPADDDSSDLPPEA